MRTPSQGCFLRVHHLREFYRNNGVRDKFENHQLFPVPFTPKDVVSFAYAHQPFAPGPTLYYALIHEFGRSMVEDAFDSAATIEQRSNNG
jgi:hypothetical protein